MDETTKLRRSSRLAGRGNERQRDDDDNNPSSNKQQLHSCHRPKPTAPAWKQDCGILPSE
jgi:hypothetical protein